MFFILGPCVIESRDQCMRIAEELAKIDAMVVFKASYDKANRTISQSFRGPGLYEGLRILDDVRQEFGMQLTSDVHTVQEAETASVVLDIVQVPAFLARQTDLIHTVAATAGKINIKKPQWMNPEDTKYIVEKCGDHPHVILTERGSMFGYDRLVNDITSIPIMQQWATVCFDATHSVQRPGGSTTKGNRDFVPTLAKAAVAAGCDAVFMETHYDPDNALSDGPNMVHLKDVPDLVKQLLEIHEVVKCQSKSVDSKTA